MSDNLYNGLNQPVVCLAEHIVTGDAGIGIISVVVITTEPREPTTMDMYVALISYTNLTS